MKDRIIRDALDVGLDEIRDLDVDKDHLLIDRALQVLSKENDRSEAVEKIQSDSAASAMRDF